MLLRNHIRLELAPEKISWQSARRSLSNSGLHFPESCRPASSVLLGYGDWKRPAKYFTMFDSISKTAGRLAARWAARNQAMHQQSRNEAVI